MSNRWTAELYEDRPGHYPIQGWLDGLTDQQSLAQLQGDVQFIAGFNASVYSVEQPTNARSAVLSAR